MLITEKNCLIFIVKCFFYILLIIDSKLKSYKNINAIRVNTQI